MGPNAGAVVRIFGSRWSRLQKEDTQKCSRIVSEGVSEGVCEGEEGSQEKKKRRETAGLARGCICTHRVGG